MHMCICGDFEYILQEDSTVCIQKYLGNESVPVLPDRLDGYRVSAIGSFAFAWNESLKEVSIPEGVEVIQNNAFMHCDRLEKVYLPDTVKEIWYSAFESCRGLEKVRLPARINGLGDSVFAHCTALEKVEIPEEVTYIGLGAFAGCTSLKRVVLPESLQRISMSAFRNCSALEELRIPSSVKHIDEDAFEGCAYLVITAEPDSEARKYACRMGIPTETVRCGDFDYAIQGDGTLVLRRYLGTAKDVRVPAEVNGCRIAAIGEAAFRAQKQLKCVMISEGVKRIGEGAFGHCTGLENLYIPSSVCVVERHALVNCKALADIRVSEENPCFFAEGGALYETRTAALNAWPSAKGSVCVKEGTRCIGEAAFNMCGITDVSLPESLEVIEGYAFNWCEKIERLRFPERMELISNFAFHRCTRLREIIMPVSLGEMRSNAFHACSALEEIRLPKKLPRIPQDAFCGCTALKRVYIPDPDTAVAEEPFGFFGTEEVAVYADPDSRAAAWCKGCTGDTKVIFFAERH